MLLLVVLERRNLSIFIQNRLSFVYLFLYLRCLVAVLSLRSSSRSNFLQASGVPLRLLLEGAQILRCRLLSKSLRRSTRGLLWDHLLDLLDRKTNNAPSNLYGLGAIWFELNVFGLG